MNIIFILCHVNTPESSSSLSGGVLAEYRNAYVPLVRMVMVMIMDNRYGMVMIVVMVMMMLTVVMVLIWMIMMTLFVSQQSWFGLFLFQKFSNFTPPSPLPSLLLHLPEKIRIKYPSNFSPFYPHYCFFYCSLYTYSYRPPPHAFLLTLFRHFPPQSLDKTVVEGGMGEG